MNTAKLLLLFTALIFLSGYSQSDREGYRSIRALLDKEVINSEDQYQLEALLESHNLEKNELSQVYAKALLRSLKEPMDDFIRIIESKDIKVNDPYGNYTVSLSDDFRASKSDAVTWNSEFAIYSRGSIACTLASVASDMLRKIKTDIGDIERRLISAKNEFVSTEEVVNKISCNGGIIVEKRQERLVDVQCIKNEYWEEAPEKIICPTQWTTFYNESSNDGKYKSGCRTYENQEISKKYKIPNDLYKNTEKICSGELISQVGANIRYFGCTSSQPWATDKLVCPKGWDKTVKTDDISEKDIVSKYIGICFDKNFSMKEKLTTEDKEIIQSKESEYKVAKAEVESLLNKLIVKGANLESQCKNSNTVLKDIYKDIAEKNKLHFLEQEEGLNVDMKLETLPEANISYENLPSDAFLYQDKNMDSSFLIAIWAPNQCAKKDYSALTRGAIKELKKALKWTKNPSSIKAAENNCGLIKVQASPYPVPENTLLKSMISLIQSASGLPKYTSDDIWSWN